MGSSTRRTAGCGPACPVVWEGRTGNRLPYPDYVPVGVQHAVPQPGTICDSRKRESRKGFPQPQLLELHPLKY
jgi:hypothetical protein